MDKSVSRFNIVNGGQVISGGGQVGDGPLVSANAARIGGLDAGSGAPATWNVGGMLVVGNGTNSTGNTLTVDAGGIVTNAYVWMAGFDGNPAGGGVSNSLIVTSGGRIFSGRADGYGYGSCVGMLGAPTGRVERNTALVTGAGSVWNLEGNTLSIGYMTAIATTGRWNAVRVAAGGILTNVGTLYIGRTAYSGVSVSNDLAVTTGGVMRATTIVVGDAHATGNTLTLGGGIMNAGTLTVSPGNMLSPVVSIDGVVPLAVSGTATLAAGSYLSPTNRPDAVRGTYTVLTAGAVVDNGLALDPAADPSQWSFIVGPTNVTLTYKPKGPGATIILVE